MKDIKYNITKLKLIAIHEYRIRNMSGSDYGKFLNLYSGFPKSYLMELLVESSVSNLFPNHEGPTGDSVILP